MSATDELRRMLDEHGVKWTKPKSATEFMQTTFLCGGWGIEVLERNIGLCVTVTNVFDTPEQVIAATLGAGECEMDAHGNCTACGEFVAKSLEYVHTFDGGYEAKPCRAHNYCPNCGRKVGR